MRRSRRAAVAALACAPLAAACGGGTSEPATEPVASEPVVRILTPYHEPDRDGLVASFAEVESRGIDVEVQGVSGDFVDELYLSLVGPDRPDLAVVPQPGVVEDLVARGEAVVVPDEVAAAVRDGLLDGLADLSSFDGALYASWVRASAGLVWYRADMFEARGWVPPTTIDELRTLIEDIAADGVAPWCVGVQSGGATGWYFTDLVEILLAAEQGPAYVEAWVDHERPFDSLEVVEVLREVQRWIADPALADGTAAEIEARTVEEGFARLAEPDPPCALSYNSDFVLREIEESVAEGALDLVAAVGPGEVPATQGRPSVSGFAFPGRGGHPRPFLAGGDQLVALVDRPEVWEVVSATADPEWGAPWQLAGGFTSPRVGADLPGSEDPATQLRALPLQGDAVAVFDPADRMPAAVGSGTFWTGMLDVLDGEDPAIVAATIEASWPDTDEPDS